MCGNACSFLSRVTGVYLVLSASEKIVAHFLEKVQLATRLGATRLSASEREICL